MFVPGFSQVNKSSWLKSQNVMRLWYNPSAVDKVLIKGLGFLARRLRLVNRLTFWPIGQFLRPIHKEQLATRPRSDLLLRMHNTKSPTIHATTLTVAVPLRLQDDTLVKKMNLAINENHVPCIKWVEYSLAISPTIQAALFTTNIVYKHMLCASPETSRLEITQIAS